MKNLVLMAAMLAMLCLANGCGSDKKVIAEQSAETPETEAMASEEADVPAAAAAEEVETAVVEAPAEDTGQPEMEIEVAAEEAKAAAAEPETKTAVAEIAPEPATESEQPAKAVDPAAVAVTVNGQEITVGQVQDELAKRIEVMKKRMPAGQEMPESRVNQIHMRLTDSLVDQVLYAQMADEAGIKVSDEQVTDQIKEIAAQS
ncbi:MAG: SurA N-terminal domain-containing protein [Planctomycetota bacterium]|jgi:hypothetical protein